MDRKKALLALMAAGVFDPSGDDSAFIANQYGTDLLREYDGTLGANYLYQDSAGTTPAGAGDPVGFWRDKSQYEKHATQATTAIKPTALSGGGVSADGGDLLDFDRVTFTDYTIFCVYDPNITSSLHYILGGIPDGKTNWAVSTGGINATFDDVFVLDNGSIVLRSNEVESGLNVLTVTNMELYRNNVLYPTQSGAGSASGALSRIGNRVDTSIPYVGNIYHIAIVGRAVTEQERTATNNYLISKWGVAV